MMLRGQRTNSFSDQENQTGKQLSGDVYSKPVTRSVLGNVLNRTNSANVGGKPPISNRRTFLNNGLIKRTRSQVMCKLGVSSRQTEEECNKNDDVFMGSDDNSQQPQPPSSQGKRTTLRSGASVSKCTAGDVGGQNKENRDPLAFHPDTLKAQTVFPRPQRIRSITTVRDIDQDDLCDPLVGGDVVRDVYAYLLRLERSLSIRDDYLAGRKTTPKMRAILVDWLVQVHIRFHLSSDVLYLTVMILDRYMSSCEVHKDNLQLVGVTAMWIAAKYEEVYAPEMNDFIYITDNTYTREQMIQMEMSILRGIAFDLGRPLSIRFLRRYSKAMAADAHRHTLAKYITESTLVDYGLCAVEPSKIAAAALYLTTALMPKTSCRWNATMVHYSSYQSEHLQGIVVAMAKMLIKIHEKKSKLVAVKNRYQASKLMGISGDRYINIDILKAVLMNRGTAETP